MKSPEGALMTIPAKAATMTRVPGLYSKATFEKT
jgi:hypothetical protein